MWEVGVLLLLVTSLTYRDLFGTGAIFMLGIIINCPYFYGMCSFVNNILSVSLTSAFLLELGMASASSVC